MAIAACSKAGLTLALVLCLALGFRALVACSAWKNGAAAEPDSADYLALAASLRGSGSFAKDGTAEIFRVPGYPAFLAFLGCLGLPPAPAAIFAQVVLDAAVCFLLFFWGCRLGGGTVAGLVAALFHSLSSLAVVYTGKILSETLFVFLFCLAVTPFLLAAGGQEESSGGKNAAAPPLSADNLAAPGGMLAAACRTKLAWLLAGLALAAALLVRAVLLPLAPLMALASVLIKPPCRSLAAALFLAPLLLVYGAWTLRNWGAAGYVGFSSVGAVNLYRYNACQLEAWLRRIPFREELARRDEMLASLSGQAEQARFCASCGRQEILAHPFLYAWLHLKSSLAALLPAEGELMRSFGIRVGANGTLDILHNSGLAAAARHYFHGNLLAPLPFVPLLIILLAKYLAALLGVAVLWRHGGKQRAAAAFILFVVLYFVLVGGAAATPRFRVPVEPFLDLLAAVGLAKAMGHRKAH